MLEDIFSVENFNVIEDDEYYYFFRAMEFGDLDDEISGKISESDGYYSGIRTYRERYNERHSIPSRYNDSTMISLDEVYSHVKKNFYPGTNCISFSSNCNVSLDYGNGIDKYVMMRVPKKGDSSVYSVGQYMLVELNKELERIISKMPNQVNFISTIRRIEKMNSSEDVIRAVKEEVANFDNFNHIDNYLKLQSKYSEFNKSYLFGFNEIKNVDFEFIL